MHIIFTSFFGVLIIKFLNIFTDPISIFSQFTEITPEISNLVFDSIIQPTKMIKNVPLYNMYLYDPSFGVPLKYLIVVLN